ncbi:hypothetical protein LTR10_009115 [Elasticomyces elasticus]|nr:hypothetical protein LTR10_009115 [Elasticomyces elasticus]KAK4964664.1 hypothetical protein LTR42_012607 [Elasticomyces elasticus]
MPHRRRHRRQGYTTPRIIDGKDAQLTKVWKLPQCPKTSKPCQARAAVGLPDVVHPDIELSDQLDAAVARYNNLYDFAPSRPQLDVEHERRRLRTKLDGIRNAVAALELAITDATDDLHEAAVTESHRLPLLNKNIHWYEQGNLLVLSARDADRALKAHRPENHNHYGSYVRHCITDRISTYAKEGDAARKAKLHAAYALGNYDYPHDYKVEADPMFAHKSLRLIFALLSCNGGAFTAFHELLWAKANVLRLHWALPTTLEEIETLGNGVDTTLDVLLDREYGDQPFRYDVGILDLKPIRSIIAADYYDVVAARRNFYAIWEERSCTELEMESDHVNDITDNWGNATGPCWHTHNRVITSFLDDYAAEEIASNARLATEHRLPTELVVKLLIRW